MEWGGELYWAADFTSGGAPIGMTLDEMRADMVRDSDAGWARAKRVLDMLVEGSTGTDAIHIDRVRKIGDGSSHEVFAASVEVHPDPEGRSGSYAVLIPARSAESAPSPDPWRAWELLDHIAERTQAIRVATIKAIVPTRDGRVIVRRYLEGVPLDPRAGRQNRIRPWDVFGRVAAAIHAMDAGRLPALPGYATRRAHGEALVAGLDELPELRDAHAWALDHLPPEEPASLLHGELLGQNILVHPEDAPAVLGWEHAMVGDPAYDLAVITAGARRPFQIDRGLQRLLDAYAVHGGRRIAAAEVHFHELCMAARWHREALEEGGDRARAAGRGGTVRNLLERARAGL